MVEFLIEGDINIAASRILVPVALATVLPGVTVPVSGTVTTADQGTVTVATILNAPLVTVQGTVSAGFTGTIEVGTVQVVVDIGTVNVVGTIDAIGGTVQVEAVGGTLANIGYIGTIGTLQSGGGGGGGFATVAVSTVESPVAVANIAYIGTIGTLQSGGGGGGGFATVAVSTVGSPVAVSSGGVVDPLNSSTITLGAGGTFQGTVSPVLGYAGVTMQIVSDQHSAANGWQIAFSPDGLGFYDNETNTFTNSGTVASSGQGWQVTAKAPYYRVTYINGASTQTVFSLQSVKKALITVGDTIDILDTPVAGMHALVAQAVVYGQVTPGTPRVVLVDSTGAVVVSGTVGFATVQGTVQAGIAGGTIGTLQAQANLAIASLVGSIGSPIAVGGGTIGVVGTVLSPVQVVGTVSTTGGGAGYSTVTGTVAVSTVQSPVGANLLGGTLGTVQSPVAVVGTVTTQPANGGTVVVATVLSPVQIAGTIMIGTVVSTGTVEAILLGGTIGTIQSPVQVVGTVTLSGGAGGGYSTVTGTVVVATLQSPVGIAGGTIGTIQSGLVSATIIGGNIPVVGTVGTLQSQSNIAIASLVGSLQSQSNIAIASQIGTIASPIAVGTVRSPVPTAPLGVASFPLVAAVLGYVQEAGSGSLQVANGFLGFPGATVNQNWYNPQALVYGSIYPPSSGFGPGNAVIAVQQTGAAGYPLFNFAVSAGMATIGATLTVFLYRQIPTGGTAQTPDASFQFFTGALAASVQNWVQVQPNVYWPYDMMVVQPLQTWGTTNTDPGVVFLQGGAHPAVDSATGGSTPPPDWGPSTAFLAMNWGQQANAAMAIPVSIPHTVTVLPTYDGSTPGVNVGTVGTVQSPVAAVTQNLYVETDILTDQTLTGGTTLATVVCGSLQGLVVDAVFGTMYPSSGSVQAAVVGVEPQSGQLTSTVVAGKWYTGTVPAGQRLQASGPLGGEVAVQVVVATGTVVDVYLTAQQSTGP